MDTMDKDTPLNEAAVRQVIRGLVGSKVTGDDQRWQAEDQFWGGLRTTIATLYSPTLNRIWRLIVIGTLASPDATMQLVEVFDGTAFYADLNIAPLHAFGPARSQLGVVVAAHALVDAIADLS